MIKPFPSIFGKITILRLKGARPRISKDSNVVETHQGSGAVLSPTSVDDEGDLYKPEIDPDHASPQGALLEFTAEKEYDVMRQGFSNKGFDTDYPIAFGHWKNLFHLKAPVGFVIAGMFGEDIRINIQGVVDPNKILIDIGNGHLLATDMEISKDIYQLMGKDLRAFHDKGYFHQYPYSANWGVQIGKNAIVRVILRDLDTTLTRRNIPKQNRDRIGASLRLVDIERVISSLTGQGRGGEAFLNPHFMQTIYRPLIESFLKGYFYDQGTDTENFRALVDEDSNFMFPRLGRRLLRSDEKLSLNELTPNYGKTWKNLYDLVNKAMNAKMDVKIFDNKRLDLHGESLKFLKQVQGLTLTGKNSKRYQFRFNLESSLYTQDWADWKTAPTDTYDIVEINKREIHDREVGWIEMAPMKQKQGYYSTDGRLRLIVKMIKIMDVDQRQGIFDGFLKFLPSGNIKFEHIINGGTLLKMVRVCLDQPGVDNLYGPKGQRDLSYERDFLQRLNGKATSLDGIELNRFLVNYMYRLKMQVAKNNEFMNLRQLFNGTPLYDTLPKDFVLDKVSVEEIKEPMGNTLSVISYWTHKDKAMTIQSDHTGGIDLNPAQMSLQVKKAGDDFSAEGGSASGEKFQWNGQTFDAAQITGATFTIESMSPVTDLPQILGLNQENNPLNQKNAVL